MVLRPEGTSHNNSGVSTQGSVDTGAADESCSAHTASADLNTAQCGAGGSVSVGSGLCPKEFPRWRRPGRQDPEGRELRADNKGENAVVCHTHTHTHTYAVVCVEIASPMFSGTHTHTHRGTGTHNHIHTLVNTLTLTHIHMGTHTKHTHTHRR